MLNLIDHYYNGEKLYQKYVDELIKEFHITSMEFNIIIFLHNNKNYDTAAQIVKFRHLTKSHVSTSIKGLIEQGYLTSFYKENDHKTIHLSLTSKSEQIVKLGVKMQEDYINKLTKNFSKDERKLLRDFFNRIDKNLNEELKERTNR